MTRKYKIRISKMAIEKIEKASITAILKIYLPSLGNIAFVIKHNREISKG